MKSRFYIAAMLFALVVVACSSSDAPQSITVEDFVKTPESYLNKTVRISGMVSHTCRHGGKRMFIYNSNRDETVKIVTGNKIPKFDVELEGKQVVLQGKVVEDMRIDDAYLDNWEAEVKADTTQNTDDCPAEEQANEAQHKDKHKNYVGEHHHPELAEIEKWRKKVKQSADGYVAFYAVKCNKLIKK